MQTKKYLYAAVGAQVAIAKAAQEKIEHMRTRLTENAKTFSTDTRKRIDDWASEGEQFVESVTDGKAIDELASKMDFDQMQTQVHKLRDQLEDLVATWRTNFRPAERGEEKVEVKVEAEPAPAKKPAARKPAAAKKPAAKKPAAATKKAS